MYNIKHHSLDDLEMAIKTQFIAINSIKELCVRVCEFTISNMTKSTEKNGWQFKHLL